MSHDQYLEAPTSAMSGVKAALALPQDRILGVGMSVSGVTDFENQIIDRSNELDWTEKPRGI